MTPITEHERLTKNKTRIGLRQTTNHPTRMIMSLDVMPARNMTASTVVPELVEKSCIQPNTRGARRHSLPCSTSPGAVTAKAIINAQIFAISGAREPVKFTTIHPRYICEICPRHCSDLFSATLHLVAGPAKKRFLSPESVLGKRMSNCSQPKSREAPVRQCRGKKGKRVGRVEFWCRANSVPLHLHQIVDSSCRNQ
jgi:hypothetical protein